MPSPKIDWALLKSKAADTTALYALTERQATVLLSICQILGWRSTFRVNDYDYSDWDEVQSEADDLQRGLMMPVYITDLIAELQAIREAMSFSPCCDDGTTVAPVPDYDLTGAGDVPEPVIGAGYATDVTDWTGYNEYKCMAAHLFLNVIQNRLIAMQPIVTGGFALFGVLAGLLALMGVAPALVIAGIVVEFASVAVIISALKDPAIGILDDLAQTLEDNRDDIVCALVGSDGIDDAVDVWGTEMDSIFSDANALLLKNLNIKATLRSLFYGSDGTGDTAQDLANEGFDPANYTCCPELAVAQFVDFSQGSSTSHNQYDVIYENQDVNLVSELSGAMHVCNIAVRAADGLGPFPDTLETQLQLTVTAINGWTTKAGFNEWQRYIRSPTAPNYVNGQAQTIDIPSITTPWEAIQFGPSNNVGWILGSNTAFTMTVRLTRLNP